MPKPCVTAWRMNLIVSWRRSCPSLRYRSIRGEMFRPKTPASPKVGQKGAVSTGSGDKVKAGSAIIVTLVRPSFCVRRSEEHTSELQSLMRISYAVFCLKKKKQKTSTTTKKHPTITHN